MTEKEDSGTDSAALTRLRPQDEEILQAIAATDDHQTTLFHLNQDLPLQKHQIRYSLTEKLCDHDYITTWTPDGTMTARVNGQKRTFPQPLHVKLTATGQQYLEHYLTATPHKTGDNTRDALNTAELTRRLTELETQHNALKDAFQTFRQQVRRELRDNT